MTAPAPAALDVLARAEKRLIPMIARRGIDAEVLAVTAMYERMYRTANGDVPVQTPVDDLAAVVDATSETWPASRGFSPSGNTWLCPEPGCAFGVGGLDAPADHEDFSDPIGEHLAEHAAERLGEEAAHEEPVVSPVLLTNAREEIKARARRKVMDRWAAGTNRLPSDVQDVTR